MPPRSFNFINQIIGDYIINIDAGKDLKFKIVDREKTHARILFTEKVFGIIRVEFKGLSDANVPGVYSNALRCIISIPQSSTKTQVADILEKSVSELHNDYEKKL